MKKKTTIDKLIISSPYEEPKQHWHYIRETREFELRDKRRNAGYTIATPNSKGFDDPGIFIPIELVNQIRPRVKDWRENGYKGTSGMTRRLLKYWQEEDRDRRFFFCQLEAIETLIWLTEAPEDKKVGIDIPADGGLFSRWCSKMATGTGKTVIMAMIIAWHVLNKVSNPQNTKFSKNVLVIAPGLTVKSRLSVLNPSAPDNYYEAFHIVPGGLMEKLRQGRILIENWHKLAWDDADKIAKKKGVDKRGPKSDAAYCKDVLGNMAKARNIMVINDEAHHAWRVNPELKVKREQKDQAAEATIWVGGLDRVHNHVGILQCFDLSATPFAPSGKKTAEEALFAWIVSDFGLNDAIEAGLVKTPRVVIRDNGKWDKNLRSQLYHLYKDTKIKEDLNRKGAKPSDPLPQLLCNAYSLLGADWLATRNEWKEQGHDVPPVMITVANRTETSARIKFAFDHEQILISELCNPEKTLQIDSKVLSKAESQNKNEEMAVSGSNDEPVKLTKKQKAELLRQMVDTVGQSGQPGGHIQNVISVGMLSEGWDAKTVTQIMGLRAFSSQLLCEQVVGRGLRRMSYDDLENGLFKPEYVNVFGVPFTFLPHEDGNQNSSVPPSKPRTRIEPIKENAAHEISWPNVIRIDYVYRPALSLDMEKVSPINLDPYENIIKMKMTAVIEGKPFEKPSEIAEVDFKKIAEKFRIQKIIFETAKQIFNSEKPLWKGRKELLLLQLIHIIENFISSDKVKIVNDLFSQDKIKRRVLIMLNVNKVVQHIWNAIRSENVESLTPILDNENRFRSTANMRVWHTSKPCISLKKSHINFIVCDSTWEASEAYILENHKKVDSFVKNDHLGFSIYYNYQGVIRRYYPDFIVRLKNKEYLILETKGQSTDQDKTKLAFLNEWVKAVNTFGIFNKWHWAVSSHPSDVEDIIGKLKI